MVLQAFIDDCGSEPQSSVFALEGFVASHEAWAKFSDERDAALREPPSLAYFKMSEAANFHGQFAKKRGWTEQKRNDRLIGLASIIRKHALARVAESMPQDGYLKHIASLPASARSLSTDTPYPMLVLQTVLAVAVGGLRHGINEPCDFIFDEQVGFSDEIMRRWPQINDFVNNTKNGLAEMVGSRPIFRDELSFKPLQAADLYAWQIQNHLVLNRGKIFVPPT